MRFAYACQLTGTPLQDIQGHSGPVKVGSDRSFGAVFVAVFVVIGLWPVVSGGSPRLWALLVALGFLVPTALVMRLRGKDMLDIDSGKRTQRESYWILRSQRTIDADSMRNQF